MIRFKTKIFEDYFIDPETAIITDVHGNVQNVYLNNGRFLFKGMKVHLIQIHTHRGYECDKVVHHIDENPMNNSLSNLQYLTKSEHSSLHHKGKTLPNSAKEKMSIARLGNKNALGFHHTDEFKKRMHDFGLTLTGERNGMFGKHLSEQAKHLISENSKKRRWWNNKEKEVFVVECPGNNWIKGRLSRKTKTLNLEQA